MMPAESFNTFLNLRTLLDGIVPVEEINNCKIHGLSLDSRAIAGGDLFFACDGYREHGIKYAFDVYRQGAAAILWESSDDINTKTFEDLTAKVTIPLIEVNNLKNYIGIIAERFYANPSKDLTTIGITGTNGKTSCSHFLAQALTNHEKCGLIGTLGFGLYGNLQTSSHTTPDPITLHALFAEMRSQGAKYVAMEVSSHALVQGRVAGVEFELAIFTNLSRDHLDYHSDMQNYGAAKKQLFDFATVKHAVINIDDEFGRQIIGNLSPHVVSIGYGFSQPEQNVKLYVRGKNLSCSHSGILFDVESSWGNFPVRSSLLGQFNASNLLAVIAALLAMNVSLEDAIKRVEKCGTIPGRMERVGGIRGLPLVVVDYAHTPDALEKALKALLAHKPTDSTAKLICVFGCGGDRDVGKRPLMGQIAEEFSDLIILTNDNPRTEPAAEIIRAIMAGIKNPASVLVESDRTKAIARALELAGSQDIVLVAGKGHEDYQIIGTDKIAYQGDRNLVQSLLGLTLNQGKFQ